MLKSLDFGQYSWTCTHSGFSSTEIECFQTCSKISAWSACWQQQALNNISPLLSCLPWGVLEQSFPFSEIFVALTQSCVSYICVHENIGSFLVIPPNHLFLVKMTIDVKCLNLSNISISQIMQPRILHLVFFPLVVVEIMVDNSENIVQRLIINRKNST